MEQKTQEQERQSGIEDFILSYEPDGVYLTVKNSKPLSIEKQERVIRHFSRKRIKDLDMDKLVAVMNGESAEHMLIAPPQEENIYDEGYSITISPDMMTAAITLIPPEPGKGRRLSEETVLENLGKLHQVTFGVDREALHALFLNPVYDEPQVIARGIPPKPGEDGRLEWHIERRDGSAVYRLQNISEDEKVDYKKLNLFVSVKKDQPLVTRIPPKEGEPGRTVTGREIRPSAGKNYVLPQGKNTYVSQDGQTLLAATSGRVDEVSGRLEVSNTYHVRGDVDLSVGNIEFDGDVIVDGNVLNDFSIKASGSIEVRGMVEAAYLDAGGDIFIDGGVQGANKGVIQAKEGVYVRFAEYANIQAGSIVSAQTLLHSNVSCLGAVEVLDGRGSIIGGNICAGNYIAARLLGNHSGRPTELRVGLSPQSRSRLAELEKEVESLKKKMEQIQYRVQQTPDVQARTERERELRMQAVRMLLQLKKQLQDDQIELEELRETLSGSTKGEVHALTTAYPGVSIVIGLSRMLLDQPVTFATFKNEDGEIRFSSCRFRPSRLPRRRRRR